MNRIFFLFLLAAALCEGQVTLRITSLPANTPANSTIYMAGSINSWNTADSNYAMQSDGLGNWQIVIPQGTGTVEYKFTRGSWPTVEGNATGGFLPNRSFTFTGAPQTINLTIQSWEDLGNGANSTAASNVQILSNSCGMPQLSTTRRIWLYLPPDYTTSTKNYPVLYMQDGQNLFDNATSFSGEWQVDETLNNLFNQGDFGAIVVGIDNGAGERLNEYSPWINTQYGGGDGDDYAAFMANTLKPYIDANYRTRPEPAFNALIGSSMGGLIATYGACEFPNAFSKVGSMSPAYWFALSSLNSYINTSVNSLQNHRMYFVAGTNESSTMVSNINIVRSNLIARGLTSANALTKFDNYGTHTEGYWRGEFGPLYRWLFQNENLSLTTSTYHSPEISQTISGKIYVEGFPSSTDFGLFDIMGKKIMTITLSNGIYQIPEDLSKGIYILRTSTAGIPPFKLVRN